MRTWGSGAPRLYAELEGVEMWGGKQAEGERFFQLMDRGPGSKGTARAVMMEYRLAEQVGVASRCPVVAGEWPTPIHLVALFLLSQQSKHSL